MSCLILGQGFIFKTKVSLRVKNLENKKKFKRKGLSHFGGVLANSPKVEFLGVELKLEGTNFEEALF